MDFLLHMFQFHFYIGSQRLLIFEAPCVSRECTLKRIVHKVNAVTSTEIPVTPETAESPPIAGCIFPRLQSAIMIIRARAANSSTLIQSIQSMLATLTDSLLLSSLFFLLFSFSFSNCAFYVYFTKWQYRYTMYDTFAVVFSRKTRLILSEVSRFVTRFGWVISLLRCHWRIVSS